MTAHFRTPNLHWVPTEQYDGPDKWRPARRGSRCRFTVGPGHRNCLRPAVFEMRRGGAGWWGYCADHLYGREIHNGVLMIRLPTCTQTAKG